jgi:uncharacterized protein YbjQ (UPF0145 family)
VRCQLCGEENAESAAFCERCGANLASEPVALVEQPAGHPAFNAQMVTTGPDFAGYRIVSYLGVVRGLTVRSRSVLGNLAGQVQTMFGGSLSIYIDLCEHARAEAYDLMVQHAQLMGANAVVAMRYDANDVMEGVTEVLAYGTAVIIEPAHSA